VLQFLRSKALHLVPVLFVVTCFSFLLTALLPGDIALVMAGPNATPQGVAALRKELQLDQPLPLRYVDWLSRAARGDLGTSPRSQQTVLSSIQERLPISLELLLLAELIGLVIAVPVGIASAYRAGGILDQAASGAAFGVLAIPGFVVAIVLIYLFAVQLDLVPATGYTPFATNPFENLQSFFLPALTVGLGEAAAYTRLLRSDMIATLQEDYIAMARAKGLPTWHILFRHALKPSSFTLLTVLGINIGRLMGGALIVETIFALPGIGRLLVESIYARDLVVVQGVVAFVAVAFVLVNFGVDLLYAVLDPRIRHGRAVA
jgi:peptide/nickel transport system permease protein